MPEQTEKLLHFTEEVVRNAAQQSEQMKKELDREVYDVIKILAI